MISIVKKHLKELLSKGKVLEAIDELKDNLDRYSDIYNDVIMLKGRFSALEERHSKGLINNNEYRSEANVLSNSLLKIIDNLKDKDFKDKSSEVNPYEDVEYPDNKRKKSEDKPKPKNKNDLILGKWRCQDPDNNFEMRIEWDKSEGRYEGKLTKQGVGSEKVGYEIGETFYFAYPTNTAGVLNERYYAKIGLFGIGLKKIWNESTTNINSWSSKNEGRFIDGRYFTRI